VLATILCASGPLDSHDDVVRRRVEAHRGRVIRSTNETILATFDSAVRAIRCAAALRASAGIPIRVGVHTGEVDICGDDIAGVSSRVSARLAALAQPGEILTSRMVKDLVVGSGIAFADRVEHELTEPGEYLAAFALLEA
jgi:class 3 adenylate cyclase